MENSIIKWEQTLKWRKGFQRRPALVEVLNENRNSVLRFSLRAYFIKQGCGSQQEPQVGSRWNCLKSCRSRLKPISGSQPILLNSPQMIAWHVNSNVTIADNIKSCKKQDWAQQMINWQPDDCLSRWSRQRYNWTPLSCKNKIACKRLAENKHDWQ